ncbi:MAG TPA: hypothetical protein VHA06_12655 [Candidatus Angelobacter sp.]|nr:hypothetical protein [Candidatus Angelobacter sp.]
MHSNGYEFGFYVWGLEARPRFYGLFLDKYRQGQKLTQAGNLGQATAFWRTWANDVEDSGPEWVSVWLLQHAAAVFIDSRKWEEVKQIYSELLVKDNKYDSEIKMLMLERLGTSPSP